MTSASPPTHQGEAATSAPPPQRHDDDWPSSFSSSSSSSSSQNHQQDEEGFETILKQIFPNRPSGVIRRLLGTNPTREKALEVANYLADESPTTGNNEAQPPPSTPGPTPAPAPSPASPNASVQTHYLLLIRSMTSNKPLDARDVRDGDKIAFNNAKNQIRRIREYAAECLRANAINMSENMEAVKEEDDNGDANFVARDEGVREALYDKQDLSTLVRVKYDKTPDEHSLIYNVIKPNALIEDLTNEEIMQIIDVFKPGTFKEGEVVICQGEMGSEIYVVESGELIEHVEGGVSKARIYARGDACGEFALLPGSKSTATITATTDVRVWILERIVYGSVICSIRMEQYQEKHAFIRDCVVRDRPFSTIFDSDQIKGLAITAKVDNFEKDEVIIREGEIVETFYIVRSGRIVRYKTNSAGNRDKVGTIDERKVFGTTSLLKGGGSPYTYRALTRVKVFYLTCQDFTSIMGSVKNAFDNNTAVSSVAKSTRRTDASQSTIVTSSSLRSIYKCDLDDLTFCNVLDKGGFGYVRLVQSKKTKRLFAMKAQPKHNIVQQKKEDRFLNEFVIATQVEHKNLLRIHCAMQDKKFVYYLMDFLPCGNLRSRLKNTNRCSERAFDEKVTKFYAASVVLAFEHLHNLKIAHRDLKPENIVLNKKGYGVLVDFGLAKDFKRVEGLTYTICGTCDYLAPEVIRRTGHNWAVDYWTLGIFLFEMTKGTPPFYSPIDIVRMLKILKGFGCIHVPRYFTSGLSDLISQLLNTDQSNRLGRTQNGIQSIKNHRWFAGFDWEGFENQTLGAPIQPELPPDLKKIRSVMNNKLKQEIDATPYSEWWPDLRLETRFSRASLDS